MKKNLLFLIIFIITCFKTWACADPWKTYTITGPSSIYVGGPSVTYTATFDDFPITYDAISFDNLHEMTFVLGNRSASNPSPERWKHVVIYNSFSGVTPGNYTMTAKLTRYFNDSQGPFVYTDTKVITIGASDFTASITSAPSSLTQPSQGTLNFKIKNIGNLPPQSNSTVAVYYYPNGGSIGTPKATYSISSIAPGGESNYSFTILTSGFTPGTYKLLVRADYNGNIIELNETNNDATHTLNISSPSGRMVSEDAFTFEDLQSEPESIKLVSDLSGRIIWEKGNTLSELDVTTLNKGTVYIIQYIRNNKVYTLKQVFQ